MIPAFAKLLVFFRADYIKRDCFISNEALQKLADRKGFEDASRVAFRTHPRLNLMVGSESPHPSNNFGCTPCHGGNGVAVDRERPRRPLVRVQGGEVFGLWSAVAADPCVRGGIEVVAAHENNRHAVSPSVVDRHGGVHESDGAMAEHHLRLAGRLEVAVRHRDR